MRFLAVAVCAVLLAGCSDNKPAPAARTAAPPEHAPDVFQVRFDTTKGPFVVEVNHAWAPHGADRFYELVTSGYFDGDRFYRVARNFVVQWGINGDPNTTRLWSSMRILDDPVKASNKKGALSFAALGPASRTTNVFINLKDNLTLDKQNFPPIGKVVSGMDVVERLYGGYGDIPPRGAGPDPTRIEALGNTYLDSHYPRLDAITKATLQK